MSDSFFDQLRQAAAAQPERQRLLFVFAGSELPEGASAAQRAAFEAGQGGHLNPLACVDKAPSELGDFEALVAESRQACPPWQAVFIAACAGTATAEPPTAQVTAALQGMVAAIRAGRLEGYLALDPAGDPLQFQAAG